MTIFPALCWNPITWMIETVVNPMIEILVNALYPVFEVAVELLGELMTAAFADIFYDVFCILLKLVSFFSNAFFVFAGVYNIATPDATGAMTPNAFLLETILWQKSLTAVYWLLTFLSALLCLIFTIILVARSASNTEYNPRKTIGKIMGKCGQTMLIFLIIPLFMLAGANLATIISGRLVEDLFEQGSTSVDNIIFLTATMEAAIDDSYNGANASFDDAIRKPYFDGKTSYDAYKKGGKDRLAKDYFDFTKLDFLTGFIVAGFMIFILFGAALFAVRRIMEILLLYVAAPFFVATIPTDDGKKFGAWRDMFVAKLVSCYGLILLMMLYLSAAPIIMSGSLVLTEDGFMNSLLKTLLLLGGAFAVKNSHSIVLGILNPQAAQAAQQSVAGGIGMATMAGAAVGRTMASPFAGSKGGAGGSGADSSGGGKSGGSAGASDKVNKESAAWKNPASLGNKFNG